MQKNIQNIISFINSSGYSNSSNLYYDYRLLIFNIALQYYEKQPPRNNWFEYSINIQHKESNDIEKIYKLLQMLKENNLIKDYEKITNGSINLKTLKIFPSNNNDVCKLFEGYILESYKDELLDKNNQKSKIAEYIYKKFIEFNNTKIIFQILDDKSEKKYINPSDLNHIKILETFRSLEGENIIKINSLSFCSPGGMMMPKNVFRIHLEILDVIKLKKLIINRITKESLPKIYKKININKNESEENNQVKKISINYDYSEINELGNLTFGKRGVVFKRHRAVIINYFYSIKEIDNNYKSFHDVNLFLKNKHHTISSPKLRQDVIKINNRINKESGGLIQQIIVLKEKSKDKEINFYKWEIKA